MGAVVLKRLDTSSKEIEAREVIDGQQRITTLQLLIDAAQEVAEGQGWEDPAYNLRHLVRNDEHFARKNPERVFKVWPTLQDRVPFEAAMTNGTSTSAFDGSAIVQCHAYFKLRVSDWVAQAEPSQRLAHVQALEFALVGLLELVVIDLGAGDDAFVIFETLNARGTPLRPSDLVKNDLIQQATIPGMDPETVSRTYWSQFEDPWWQSEIRQGRLRRPRVDTFLDYWLEARSGDEVQSWEVFPTFQRLVEAAQPSVADLAESMKEAAAVYREIEEMNRYSRDGTFLYRWDVLDARVLTPLLLWVFSLHPNTLTPERRTRLLVGLESFLVRRAIGRQTTKQYNRLFLDALQFKGTIGHQRSRSETTRKGTKSLRIRRLAVSGRSVQRSFTVHGDHELAEQRRRELADRFGLDRRVLYCEGARWTVAELLDRFIAAEHPWRPATRSSHASVARFLVSDPLGRVGVAMLAPVEVERAVCRWRAAGGSSALVWGRWAVLHSALSWAAAQGYIRANPIRGMRAPSRPAPRTHLLPSEVAALLTTAADQVRAAEKALDADPDNGARCEALFVAEQNLVLVRLAADSGARRGELAVLRLSDLNGRVDHRTQPLARGSGADQDRSVTADDARRHDHHHDPRPLRTLGGPRRR